MVACAIFTQSAQIASAFKCHIESYHAKPVGHYIDVPTCMGKAKSNIISLSYHKCIKVNFELCIFCVGRDIKS